MTTEHHPAKSETGAHNHPPRPAAIGAEAECIHPISDIQYPTSGPPAASGAEAECIEAAWEIQVVLEEEAEALKRFAGADLLKLISWKEFLVGEFSQKLDRLRTTPGAPLAVSASLKAILGKIDALNRSNKYFIQSSLSHWQDLLSLLGPSGYGPAAEEVKSGSRPPKGLAFSREI